MADLGVLKPTKVQCTKVMFNANNTVSTQLFGEGFIEDLSRDTTKW
jgi:hypothetical protein